MEPTRQSRWRFAGTRCAQAARDAGTLCRLAARTAQDRAGAAAIGTALVAAGVWLLHPSDAAAKAWIIGHGPSTPRLVKFAEQVSHWGELHLVPAMLVVVLWVWGWRMRRRKLQFAAGAGLLAMVVAGLLTDGLKWVIGRPRPYVPDVADVAHWFHGGAKFASFPSGHATHCCALVAAVALLADRGTTLVLAVLAGLVMWARYYTSGHYPTDLLAGAWVGTAVGLAFGLAAKRWLAPQASRSTGRPA